jgi:hypothetical protein
MRGNLRERNNEKKKQENKNKDQRTLTPDNVMGCMEAYWRSIIESKLSGRGDVS